MADKQYKWRPLLRMERLIFDDNEKKKWKTKKTKQNTETCKNKEVVQHNTTTTLQMWEL